MLEQGLRYQTVILLYVRAEGYRTKKKKYPTMSPPGPSGGNPGKFYIKAPHEWTPGQPYTETPRAKGEVRFVLPGARRKQAAQRMSLDRPTLLHLQEGLTHHDV